MAIAVWIASGILALLFVVGGAARVVVPASWYAAHGFAWVADMPRVFVVVSLLEVAGGVGVIVPALTGVAPILTPLAACGLAVVMLMAAGFHVARREGAAVAFGVIYAALAVFVAGSRFVGV